ncbi:MAG TPA: NlpC/P60 family protein [Bacteroidales bacterium]|nr:NlpC/P60 family protein [Bacteroidales bacterium]
MKFFRIITSIFPFFIIPFLFAQDDQFPPFDPYYSSDILLIDSLLVPTNCPKLDSIIHFALNQRGKQYKYGTFGPNTFDCSGLMFYTFNQFGIQLGRSSRDQYQQGIEVDVDDIQPGDLVFFYRGKRSKNYIGHVGLVVSVDSSKNFTFVHSSTPKTGVRIDYSHRPGYLNSFVGARRIVHCDESLSPKIILNENKSLTENTTPVLKKNSTEEDMNTYVVKQGDTLYGISKKLKIPVEQIQKNNNLKSDKIFPGQKIKF